MATETPETTTKIAPGCVRTGVALAKACGVSSRTIATWKNLAGFPTRADETYSIWQVAEWYWTVGPGATKQSFAIDPELVPDAGDSPGLERYRLARAAQEEIKLAGMRGSYLDRGWMHTRLSEMASILRGIGEILQRQFGDEARQVLDDGLTEFESKIEDATNE